MGKIKDTYQKIKRFLPNRYWVTLAVFFIVIAFVDSNNLIKRFRYDIEIRQLQRELEESREACEKVTRQLEDLRQGTQEVEKIAREQYLMKKDNEVIFILEEE